MVRIDLFLSPFGLIFSKVEYCKELIHKYFVAISILELIFLLDDGINLHKLYSRIKFDNSKRLHIKLFNNALLLMKQDLIVPIADLIVIISRLSKLGRIGSEQDRSIYMVAALYIIRLYLCKSPQDYWIEKLSKFYARTNKVIVNVINVILTVVLVSNFLTCMWIKIGELPVTEGLTYSWIRNNEEEFGTFASNPYGIYIYSMYFIWTIFTTVGYGDVYTENTVQEMFFLVSIEMIAIGMTATLLYTIAKIFNTDNSYKSQLRYHLNEMDKWILKMQKLNN